MIAKTKMTYVVLPGDGIESDWVDVLVEDEGQ